MLILYTTEDGKSRIQLRADEDTVWLTQLEMADLFATTKQNISLHLQNIFEDGELREATTVKESLTVQIERGRTRGPAPNLTQHALSHKNVFMRTTLDLPDPLFRELKARSALRGVLLKDYVAEILQTGLAQTAAAQAEARPRSPLPVIRKATGVAHPALSNREIDALLVAEDAHGGN